MRQIATINVSALTQNGDAQSFDYTDAFGRPAKGLLLRWAGELRAFRNLCPHWSMPLDADTGEFFDANKSALLCKMHGARFDPANGECIMGPCEGDRLEALQVEVSDDGNTATIRRGRTLSF
ncbi:Rieske (2Fe-2S) protein [Persicimonas caeni]|uniref:Rieske (2Fe-2S) protein n=1 Tax=Persicimonas caeni TaxID=2292766 RepID=A0A4Y6PUH5_PERCE|nr:Rieske (2Fe-2S) protein [Persicimonas caeni]QDG51667.1 Rieske (2Fe-2S) protein [Persicimonas caeni]QED32888.1 Rieske (2Fe-2S) protein [Persicimonas caeni]